MRIGIAPCIALAVCLMGNSAIADGCMLELDQDVVVPWEGPCQDGKAHGTGVAKLRNGTYRGSAEDGRAHGHGRLTLQDGGSYVGDWYRGKRHGKGRAVDAEGDAYEGEFVDGRPHGQGAGWSPEGGAHTGEFADGDPIGRDEGATAEDPWEARDDGSQGTGGTTPDAPAPVTAVAKCQLDIGGELLDWSGPCREGKAYGEGKATASDGSTYAGSALAGKPHGFGTVNATDGYYQGEYRNGVPHGKGVVRGPDGRYYRGEFREGHQHGGLVPMEGVAGADPWVDHTDADTVEGRAAADVSDPWADNDPWAPESTEEDPWAPADAVSGAAQDDHLDERMPPEPAPDEFDYTHALRALDGADGIVRSALPEDDYTAKLTELERLEAERRATERARETERQAEQLREEIRARQAAERRAQHEAEKASRRAALEREAEEAWRESDDSYESYQSEPSDDTLFGGGDAGQQAFEEMLQGNIPSMQRRQAGDYPDRAGTRAPSDDGGYDDCMIINGEWVGSDCGPELYRVRRGTRSGGGSIQ